MKTQRFLLAATITATLLSGTEALAQPKDSYPNRPVRLVVPNAPGGGADMLARLVSPKVGEKFGQQIVIDNRAGAGGNIAAEVVARSAPDGYTLLQGFIGHAMSASLYRKLNYDLLKDFIPVTLLASAPFMLAVNPGVPANSVRQLIALAKSQPGKLNYGSSGNGLPSHLAMELFKLMADVEIRHIPYKGGAPAATDLIAGQIQAMFSTLPVLLPHVNAGRLKGLAMASTRRVAAAPDFPTVAEAGVPGYETTTWYGVMVPAGTPNLIVNKLHSEFVAALNAPDVRERLIKQSFDLVGGTPTEFAAYVRAEIPKWAKVVKAANAKID